MGKSRPFNRLKTRLLALIFAFAGLSLSSFASAEVGEGFNTWYGGLAWLSLKHNYVNDRDLESKHDRRFFSAGVGGVAYGQRRIDFEDATTGYKVYVGVSPNENWDWEGGFIDFGETSGTYTAGQISAPFTQSSLRSDADVKGMFLHVQYRFQYEAIEGLEIVPKLGILAWDGSLRSPYFNDDPDLTKLVFVDNNRGYDEYYGIGLSYHITENVRARADYEHYTFGSAEADVMSISLDFPVPQIPYIMW